MPTELAIRRPIRKVTGADFAACPVWEWALDEDEHLGGGESFIRPTSLETIPPTPELHYIVAASTTLNDGTVLPSCMEVSIGKGKPRIEPMFLFLLDRHLDFAGAETNTMLSRYKKRSNVYPVRWQMTVLFDGETSLRTGTVRHSLLSKLVHVWRRVRGAGTGNNLLAP